MTKSKDSNSNFSLPQPKPKRFYSRWWFWLLIILALLVIGGGAAAVKFNQQAQLQSYKDLKNVTTVQTRTFSKTVSTNGQITPDETTQLSFGFAGTVTEINFKENDTVNDGDVIAKLDNGKSIKAPFDGKIINVPGFVGDVVLPTTPIVVIAFRSNHVEFTASEAEVVNLRDSQHVTITIPAYNNGRDKYDGTIQSVGIQKQTQATSNPSASTQSGYIVKVSADKLPEDLRNIIGLSVDVVVDIYQVNNAISIETGAIQYDANNHPFVYLPPVVDKAFIAKAKTATNIATLLPTKYVTLGFEGDNYVEITSGLNSGDQVLMYIPSASATN